VEREPAPPLLSEERGKDVERESAPPLLSEERGKDVERESAPLSSPRRGVRG